MSGVHLRVLIVNSGRKWIGEIGHCAMLREQLAARGHSVWLGVREGFELHNYAREKGIPHVAFGFSGSFAPMGDLRDIHTMREFIAREKIDLVHAHRGKDHWISAFAVRKIGTPLIRTRHVVTRSSQHPLNKWLYGSATHGLLSVSQAAEKGLGGLARRVAIRRVILSAVDSEKFKPDLRRADALERPEGDATIWIGLIGRIQSVKGQKQFLKAAEIVARKNHDARFLIAGQGSPQQHDLFRKVAERRGFGGRLNVVGRIENLPAVIASLDIGVVASLGSEGFSRVTTEYMASGLPVVATTVGGIPEILSEGVLVPPRDPEAMAEAILKLLNNPEERKRMGRINREMAQRNHDPKRWAESIESVYREALAKRT